MKVAVLSDLHVEFDRAVVARLTARGRKEKKSQARQALEAAGHPPLGPGYGELVDLDPRGAVACRADVIILAGDIEIGPLAADYAADLAAWLGVPVVLVAGNHEFYGREYLETCDVLQRRGDGGAHFLERTRLDLEAGGQRLRILGCTLWTDFLLFGADRQAETMRVSVERMNDFAGMIRYGDGGPFAPHHAADIFAASVAWLRSELATPFDGPTIVVTHHAPSRLSVHQTYKRDPTSAAFASHLDDLIAEAGPSLWVHGHMHHSLDYRIGRTRVVCNPRGYRPDGLNKRFRPGLLLDVPAQEPQNGHEMR